MGQRNSGISRRKVRWPARAMPVQSETRCASLLYSCYPYGIPDVVSSLLPLFLIYTVSISVRIILMVKTQFLLPGSTLFSNYNWILNHYTRLAARQSSTVAATVVLETSTSTTPTAHQTYRAPYGALCSDRVPWDPVATPYCRPP